MFIQLSCNVKVNSAFIVKTSILYPIEKFINQEDNGTQYYEYKYTYRNYIYTSKTKKILLIELHNGNIEIIREEKRITEIMSKL